MFFWAHDIGRFYGGKDLELYIRWTQFGLLNSSLRIHSIIDKNLDPRSWLWGEKYEGSNTLILQCDLNRFPLFVKGGYPIPIQPYTNRMTSTPLTKLIIRCYPGTENSDHSYTLYEDDGISKAYEKGEFTETRMQYCKKDNQTQIIIYPAKGSYKNQSQRRAYRIELTETDKNLSIRINGKKIKTIPVPEIHGQEIKIKSRNIQNKISIIY